MHCGSLGLCHFRTIADRLLIQQNQCHGILFPYGRPQPCQAGSSTHCPPVSGLPVVAHLCQFLSAGRVQIDAQGRVLGAERTTGALAVQNHPRKPSRRAGQWNSGGIPVEFGWNSRGFFFVQPTAKNPPNRTRSRIPPTWCGKSERCS